MTTLLIISILLVVSFVGTAIWRKRELPESISALVYTLPNGGWRYLWTVWIWASTFTLTPSLFEITPENWQILAHAFSTSMLFVGAMPLVKHEDNRAHNVLSIAAGIFSQLCVCFLSPVWLLLWSVMAVLAIYAKKSEDFPSWLYGKGLFVSEMVCWVILVCAIITKFIRTV